MYIYSIRCKTNDKVIHIGSTKQLLSKRWIGHKTACKTHSSYLYKYICENGGVDNFYIELFKEVKICTKQEMEKQEGEIIREFKRDSDMIVLNHNIAGNTQGLTECEYKKRLLQSNPEYAERQRQISRDYFLNPENAERNRQFNRENYRKKSGYYDRNQLESSSRYESSIDSETEQLLINENIPL